MFALIDFSASREFRGDMMMLAGIALLIWVLFRRNMRGRQQRRSEESDLVAHRKKMDARAVAGAPLADAPAEVLRWQSAMFDLQRELKAELDTKIAVVQSLVGLADERIATLHGLAVPKTVAASAPVGPRKPVDASENLAARANRVQALTGQGRTAEEIAEAMAMPVGDVEFLQSLAPARGR